MDKGELWFEDGEWRMEEYFEGKGARILDGQLRFVDFTIPHPHLILMFLVILCQESHYFKDILQF